MMEVVMQAAYTQSFPGRPSTAARAQRNSVGCSIRSKSNVILAGFGEVDEGLSRTPGKRVWANPHRGFESRPLRHTKLVSV